MDAIMKAEHSACESAGVVMEEAWMRSCSSDPASASARVDTIREAATTTTTGGKVAGHIPEEVIENILIRVPARSLARFRYVCKPWWALITRPAFATDHLRRHRPNLNRRVIATIEGRQLMSLSGDNLDRCQHLTFRHPFSDTSAHGKDEIRFRLRGHSNGIVFGSVFNSRYARLFLWNPTTGESKVLPRSGIAGFSGWKAFFFFGFDSTTAGYYVLRVKERRVPLAGRFSWGVESRAELYSLKTNSWREIKAPLPYKTCPPRFTSCENNGCVGGAFFWCGFVPGEEDVIGLILFHIAREEFEFVKRPYPQDHPSFYFQPAVFQGSIALIGYYCGLGSKAAEIWVMKQFADPDSWVKQDIIHFSSLEVHAFLSTGEFFLMDRESGRTVFWCPLAQKLISLDHIPRLTRASGFINYEESLISLRSDDCLLTAGLRPLV